MPLREGTLLERSAKRIFSLLGFRTQINAKVKGYEIDVLATYKDKKIIIECKQRDNSGTIDMRNLIHQWNSKNNVIGADRVILIIYGVQTSQAHKTLAKKLGITIWNDKEFETYMDMAIEDGEKTRNSILKNMGLSEKDFIKTREIKEMTANQKERFEILKETLQDIRGKNYQFTNTRAMSESSGFFGKSNELALVQILSPVDADDDFALIIPVLEETESDRFEELAITENWNYEIECKDPKHFLVCLDSINGTSEAIEKIFKTVYGLNDNFDIKTEIVY